MLTDKKLHFYKKTVSANVNFQQHAGLMKSMVDANTIKILYVLAAGEYVCPSEFSKILSMSLSAVSHQLGKLRSKGIVSTVRHGQVVCYFLSDSSESHIVKRMINVLMR